MNGVPLFGSDDLSGNGCILRVEFSRQTSLEVHREDSYSRDFVRNPWDEMNESFEDYRLINNYPNFRHPQNDLDSLNEDRLANLDPLTLSNLASRLIKPLREFF